MSLDDQYGIFYSCRETGDDVPSDSPIAYNLDTIIDMSMQILRNEGDFFGVINDQGVTVQFMMCDKGLISIDVPDVKRNGSYVGEINVGEIETVIRNINEYFNAKESGLEFTPW